MKELYNRIYQFIEERESPQDDFSKLINFITRKKYQENRDGFKLILHIINNISNHHHRYPTFQSKIERILNYFSAYIKQSFTNLEIFNIFQNNNHLLYYLFKNNIISVNSSISSMILKKETKQKQFYTHYFAGDDSSIFEKVRKYFNQCQSTSKNYVYYFFPEIKPFLENDKVVEIENAMKNILIDENYEINRQIGENDSYICQMIRQDSVKEFVIYANRINLPLSSQIHDSVFETNPLLIKKRATLIEYAAFYGSIQIFKYLQMSGVELSKSLWIYTIHGNSPEMIDILLSYNIKPEDETFTECLLESIKCHHNAMADYIMNNLMTEEQEINEKNFKRNKVASGFHYHNYHFIQNFDNYQFILYYACLYDYFEIVKFLIDGNKVGLDQKFFFNEIPNLILNISAFNFASQKNNIEIVNFLFKTKEYSKIEDFCFTVCQNLTQIEIPSSVTSIGNYAFHECSSLNQVVIPSSVISIGNSSFSGCSSLTEIVIPSSVTSIGNYAFQKCTLLNQVVIPSSVISIGNSSFSGCTSLTEIKISSSVKSIGDYAFKGCSSLKEISIPESVTQIGCCAFKSCSSLITAYIYSLVLKIGDNAFSGCSSLSKIFIQLHINKKAIGVGSNTEIIKIKNE